MEKLQSAFNRLRTEKKRALIPFFVGGYPSLSLTGPLLLALQDAGVDVIEIGIPFSDPLADGPVIQAASAKALAKLATPRKILKAVASVRHQLHVPVVCLTYWNPVIQFTRGGDRASVRAFLQSAHESGFSGMIVPDVPVEEGALLSGLAQQERIATIFLAAPTSPAKRLQAIVNASTGFIYYVSVTGTTGVRRQLPAELLQGVRRLKRLTTKPVCVGFGISTPAQARAVADAADGVIVGSALVRAISQAKHSSQALRNAARFTRQLNQAVKHG